MKVVAVLLLTFASLTSFAADRNEKVAELMEAQGLVTMFQQQMAAGRRSAREQADQMLEQFTKTLKPTAEYDQKFRAALMDYVNAMDAPWSAQDIVDVWAQIYGSKFSDAELDGLLAWYTSPLGRKDTAASQSAWPAFEAHFKDLSKPIVQRETQKLLERIKSIAKECNCERKG